MIHASAHPASYPGLHLLFIGTEACEPGKGWGPGVKEHYRIQYVHSGRGRFISGREDRVLEAGQLFLIEPGQIVQYEADRTEPWNYSWMVFDGGQAGATMARAGLDGAHPVLHDRADGELGALMEALLAVDPLGPGADIRQQSLFLAFVAGLVERGGEAPGARPFPSRQELYVSVALQYLQVHFSGPVSMEGLARHVGIDRKYLSALFKQHVGESPQDFLGRIRMERARLLLARPELCVADVAHSVGYDDPLAFSRAFRKSLGVSPSEFRKGVRQSA